MMSLCVLSVVSFTGCSTADSWGGRGIAWILCNGSERVVSLMRGYQKDLSSLKKEEKLEVKYPERQGNLRMK